jgi:hypothetical protein
MNRVKDQLEHGDKAPAGGAYAVGGDVAVGGCKEDAPEVKEEGQVSLSAVVPDLAGVNHQLAK